MNPILYDFKRTFIRFSILFFLAIFIAAGIGLSYLVYNFAISPHKSEFVGVNDVVVAAGGKVIVFVFNNLGNPIPNAKVEVAGTTQLTNSSGFAIFDNVPESGLIRVSYNGVNINQSYAGEMTTYYNSELIGANGNIPSFINSIITGGFGVSFTTTNAGPMSYIITTSQNGMGKIVIGTTVKDVTIKYTFSNSYNISSVKLNYTLHLDNYINVFTIPVPNSPKYFVAETPNITSFSGPFTSYSNYTIQVYYPFGVGMSSIVSTVESNSGIFAAFFPILMLYLAYTIFARPRDSGALLFLLSKPITRRQIYVNRFVAGSLTAIVSTLIFSVITYGVIDFLIVTSTGISVPTSVIVFYFLATVTNLIAFYSLVLMLSTFTKRSGITLGISIFLYFLFQSIYGVMAFLIGGLQNAVKVNYELDYFNPLGLGSLITYLLNSQYNIMAYYNFINPFLITIAALAWIVIPAVVGIWRMERTDL